ncbi:MAG TPA: metallophosphoesterase, partial [Opitutaceae bacterium]|nr:metallophosphoesterase [Opitutaceae bacterium]
MLFRHVAAGIVLVCIARAAPASLEAVLVIVGDQHSAYERAAQFLARIDRLKEDNAGVPVAVLIDGDAFEYGNAVARRTQGAIDFALLAALAKRAPTVINLGNHEPEFFAIAETVRRLEATGVKVISGNLRIPTTGAAYAPAATPLKLGRHEAIVAGIGTNWLATYRAAVRPQLDLAEPVTWAKENLPALFKDAALPILLSHAGVQADRRILELVPNGTLFTGAHDHLRFVHRADGTTYFHSGSWMEFMSVARLHATTDGLRWEVEQVRLGPDDVADTKF